MKRNNKGAAMISVLIAIMFIGLLATSLMYMSYNNYIAKSMRWSSTDNFYYDEFALDDLTSEMQQFCTKQGDIDSAISKLEIACGVSGTTYNPVLLGQNFLNIANSNGTDIKVVTKASQLAGRTNPTYKREGNTVTFKNLCIETVKYKTDSSGAKVADYTSRITVDYTISITNSDQGSMKVNDFSLMSDNPVKWETGGNLIYGGNVFCMNKANIDGTAFTVNNNSSCTFSGDRTLIVGDMVIGGNSTVCMSGQVTVTGNVKVESGSSLFCTTNLTVGGSITGGGSVHGNKTFDPAECNKIKDNCIDLFGTGGEYAGGLASIIIDDVQVIKSATIQDVETPEMDADGNKISKKQITSYDKVYYDAANSTEADYGKHSIGALCGNVTGKDYIQSASNPKTSGTKIYIRAASDNINGVDATNSLTFLPKQNQQLRGQFNNCTIIAPDGASYASDDGTSGPLLTRMNDDDYNASLNTMVSVSLYDADDQAVGMAGGSKSDFDNIVQKALANGGNGNGSVYEEKDDDGNVTATYAVIPYTSLSGTTKYAVYSNGKNYIPWGYFIRDDAEQLIMGAFDGVLGETNAMYSSVNYSNWVKE